MNNHQSADDDTIYVLWVYLLLLQSAAFRRIFDPTSIARSLFAVDVGMSDDDGVDDDADAHADTDADDYDVDDADALVDFGSQRLL